MKRVILVNDTNAKPGTCVMVADKKGNILFDIEKTKKPPTGGRNPKTANQRNQRQYNTKDG